MPATPRILPGHFGVPMARLMLSLLGLCGCASAVTPSIQVESGSIDQESRLQGELRFRMAYEQQQRVARVAFPMLTAGVEMCVDAVRYAIGMTFSNLYSFEHGSEAIAVLGLTDQVKVTSVIPGSPADRAGVRVDDLLVEAGGSPLPKGNGATEALQTKLQELSKDGRSFGLKLAHDGVLRETTVTPAKACAFSTVAIDGDVVNAFADGSSVTVTVGMMRFVQDDTELALVISHELAHNLMKHVAAKSSNQMIGVLMKVALLATTIVTRGVSGPNPQVSQLMSAPVPDRASFSSEFEAEADYVGLYMMARAGFEIERAPQFWRRMGAAYPPSNTSAFGASHPADAYRMVALERAVKETLRKIGTGMPLMPERGKSSFKEPDRARADLTPRSTAPFRITFLLDHHRRSTNANGETPVRVDDAFASGGPPFEDEINRCLSEAMTRVTPSASVLNGREFRRVAFPDLGPEEAPHTGESLLALRKSVTFRSRIAPLGLQYVGIVKVSSNRRVGGGFMPSSSRESRFSISVIEVGGQGPPYREDAISWRSSGPGNPLDLLASFDTDSQACGELGERLAVHLAQRAASAIAAPDGSDP